MYVILLFVPNTVCYGYLRSTFREFGRFLIHDNLCCFIIAIHNVQGIILAAPGFQILEYQLVSESKVLGCFSVEKPQKYGPMFTARTASLTKILKATPRKSSYELHLTL